jgi:putative DNA primase/helicase
VGAFESVPTDLKNLPQWGCYVLVPKKTPDPARPWKKDKLPINARTGELAGVSEPNTWSTFATTLEACRRNQANGRRVDGPTFFFRKDGLYRYAGIDLDDCVDPETHILEPWAAELVKALDSYTEYSPSGHGVKIWARGNLPGGGGQRGKVEMYDHSRHFTVTGRHVPGTPLTIEQRTNAVAAVYAQYFKTSSQKKTNARSKANPVDLARVKEALPHISADEYWTWLRVGMGLHDRDPGAATFQLWVEWSKTCQKKFDLKVCHEKWASFTTERDTTVTIATIFQYAKDAGWNPHNGNGHAPPPPEQEWSDATEEPVVDPSHFRCTDLGNGERLVARYGHNLRYCNPWKKWLVWDGGHWKLDDTQHVRQWARATTRAIYDEARAVTEQAKNCEPGDKKDTLVKQAAALLSHAHRSETEARTNAMIHNAQMDVPVLPEQLDVDPWLLNVHNGTLDLRTGELRPHRREDLITKCLPISYDPDARCPQWEAFLDSVLAGNQDLVDFLWKALGYSLTGNTKEDCIFLLYGTGANGKSTFQGTIRMLWGDYGKQAAFSTFLHQERETVRNDIADLRGARLVIAAETDQDKRLSEALIKQLTGRDRVKARHLFQELFEFQPQLKPWLAFNHKPIIKGQDYAMWRRIRLVPFTVKFEDDAKDEDLPDKLLTELPGILAWAVRGCLAWQQDGLPLPEAVKVATEGYKAEMDVIDNFLKECCALDPNAHVQAGALLTAYQQWSGDKKMSHYKFKGHLQDHGLTQERSSLTGHMVWLGLRLFTTGGES